MRSPYDFQKKKKAESVTGVKVGHKRKQPENAKRKAIKGGKGAMAALKNSGRKSNVNQKR